MLDFEEMPFCEAVPIKGVSILFVEGSSFTIFLVLFLIVDVPPSRVVCDNLGFFAGLDAIPDRAFAFEPVESEYVFAAMAEVLRLEAMSRIEILKLRRAEKNEEVEFGECRI